MDVPLSMTRDELSSLCAEEVSHFKGMVRSCLEEADATEAGSLAGAQASGGGCRMPLVQGAVREEVRPHTYPSHLFPNCDF